MTDTWIDGSGVVADEPLPEGAWIRFVLDPEIREKDVVAYVQGGKLHVVGPWRMLDIEQRALNIVDISPIPLASDRSVTPTD